MKGATVVSITKEISLQEPITGDIITQELTAVMNFLCAALVYKTKIIGHLKAIVTSQQEYLHFSATSLAQQSVKVSANWQDQQISDCTFTMNIIIFGYSTEEINTIVAKSLESTLFA